MASVVALLAMATGCMFEKTDDATEAAATTSRVGAQGDTSAVLKSTLLLETGCVATKVGPSLLVTSARCVVGKAKFTAGSSVGFTVASAAPGAGKLSFVVSDVKVHPSFGAKCTDDACAIGKDASDAADIAVVVLDADVETVPAIPVDLDTVGEGDPLLVVSSGCSALDAKDGDGTRTNKTLAVPTAAAGHEGGAYAGVQTAIARLGQSYVVTAGIGWNDKGVRLCASDIGAPVFRGGSASLAGVTSTVTVFDGATVPVTLEHTRVDAMSRFKIGAWLSSLGAQTLHSCSEAAGGCVKRSYDGGMPVDPNPPAQATVTGPDDDAGTPDAIAPDADVQQEAGTRAGPRTEPVGQDPGPAADDGFGDEDYADAAVPSKKSKKQAGGCSAAPGAPSGDAFLGFALAVGAVVVRRRRSR